ncbi:hypothetical protein ABZ137_14170 [Streptomyces bobili]
MPGSRPGRGTAWAGLPDSGYYIVENGKPHVLPQIEHEIRYQDLVRVDG